MNEINHKIRGDTRQSDDAHVGKFQKTSEWFFVVVIQ